MSMKSTKKSMKNKSKMVSIIIVNWNEKEMLRKCLESIKSNTIYYPYEIIVVDNNSNDGSQEMIKMYFPWVKLIENKENLGFSRANNIGIKTSKGEYVLLLNNDTEVKKGWLMNLIEFAENNKKFGVVGPKLLYQDGSVQQLKGYPDTSKEVDFVTGAAFLIKREVINKVGLLDEGFSPIYYEDKDYCMRVLKAGYKIGYTSSSVIVHHCGLTTDKLPSWKYLVGNKNRIRFTLLHYSIKELIKMIPHEILQIGASIMRMRLHLLIYAYLLVLKDLKNIIETRKRIPLSTTFQ